MTTGRLMLGLALAAAAAAARAHEAPSGWSYDRDCCHDYDCAPVPDEAVRWTLGGYDVAIAPGTHPMVPRDAETLRRKFPHGDARIRQSGDGQTHACVGTGGAALYCVYVPSKAS